MWLKVVLVVFLVAVTCAQKVKYDDYALYKVEPQSDDEVAYLKELYESSNDYDFWKPPSVAGEFVSVVSPPELRKDLEHSLRKRSIYSEIVLENIQEAFDAQLYSRRRRRDASRQLYWDTYQSLDDINSWFEELAEKHSEVSVVVAGHSHEGRNITGVKISRSGSSRRAFILEAGAVGADWLSPAVLTYIVEQLVNGEDPEANQAAEDFDWYIFPVSNPDGFQYTQDAVRLWTKNRRPILGSAVGVDLTKNWNVNWAGSGGSHVPEDNTFVGLGPFSEPETRALSNYFESIANKAGFLSFRSFGQRLLIPDFTGEFYNFDEMIKIGRRAMGSMAVKYNTQYLAGTTAQLSDGATGSAADWVKYRFNAPIAATYLLRDTGAWGYTLPVAQVLPSCEETFDSLMAIIREAKFIDVL